MNRKQRRNIILLILTIFVAVIVFIGYSSYNTTKYGSGKYYVNMFPSEFEVKNYRLPADVDLESESGEYYLLKVYFPNGGHVSFEDMYGISPMVVNEKVELEDDAGEVWYVELDKKIPST